jgi:hypothetical protein
MLQESAAKIDMHASDTKYNTQNEERLISLVMICADLNGRAVYGVLLRPLACCDCGFESCRGHGCLSLLNVVCCYPSRGVLPGVVCLSEGYMRRLWHTRWCHTIGKKKWNNYMPNYTYKFVYT